MIAILLLFSLTDGEKFAFAKGLYQDGMYEIAEKEFSSFLDMFPHSKFAGEASVLYLSTLFQEGKYNSVVKDAGEFINKYPAKAKDILVIRGRVWLQQSAWASAISDFKKVGGNRGRYWLAETYLKMGKYKKAIGLYKGVKGDLKDYAIFSIAWCYEKLKDYQHAILYLNRLIEKYPNSPLFDDGIFYKAENLYLSGNPVSAIKICNNYLKKYPSGDYRGRVYILLYEIYKSQGRLKESEDALKNVIKESLPEKNYALYRLGLLYYNEKDYENADSILSLVPPKSNFYLDAQYWMGLSYESAGNGDKAIEIFMPLVQKGGNIGNEAAYQIGFIYYKKGDFDKAMEYLSVINNGLKDAADILMGNIMMKKKDYKNAESYYLDAYNLHGRNADLGLYRNAILFYKAGEYDSSIVYLDKYRAEFPEGKWLGNVNLMLGDIYFKKKVYDKSIGYYRDAEKSGQDVKPYALQGIGWAYIGMGKYDSSFKILDSLITLFPKFEGKGEVFLEMGDAAYSIKDYKHAKAAYKRVGGEYKPEGLYRLANLYYTVGQYDSAYQTFTGIIQDFPVYSNINECWYMAGLSLKKMGDIQGSNKILRKLLSLSPPFKIKYNTYMTLAENMYNSSKYDTALIIYKKTLKLFSSPDTMVYPVIDGIFRSAYMSGDVPALRKEIKNIVFKYNDTDVEKGIYRIAGDMLYNVGLYSDALKYYKKLKSPEGEYNQALTLIRLKKRKDAENILLHLSTYPEFKTKALFQLGKLLLEDGNYSEAERYLKSAGTDEAMAYYGKCLVMEGKYDEAKDVLQPLIGKTGGLAELELGKVYEHQNKLDDAIVIYEKITDEPQVGDQAYLELGRVYMKKGEYEDALMNFLKVKYLYPNSVYLSSALFEAGKAAEKMGDKAKAVKFYNEVIERKDNNELIKKAKSAISHIK